MKILVTGGAGYIGSHTVVELLNQGHDVVVVDDFRNSNKQVIKNIESITHKEVTLYEEDCNKKEKLDTIFKQEQPNGVIHFAAYKAVGESVEQPLKYYRNNIVSLINVLECMESYNTKNIVFSSSCTVYGNPDESIVTENTSIKEAESPYGYTKQVAERILIDFQKSSSNKNVSILRYFNPIGAHPSGKLGELPIGTPNNLVPFITQTAIGKRKELTIFGDNYPTKDGTCIRDYIHVVDLANAHIKALERLESKENCIDIFNIGTGTGSSVLEVVKTFEKVNNTPLNYRFGNKRKGDVISIFANSDKAQRKLKWKPKYGLEEALKHAWKWEKNINSNNNYV